MSGISERLVIELDRKAVSLLARLLDAEYRRLQLELRIIEERVRRFEEKYGMSSSEFLERYSRGELSDEEEFVEWYGELEFLKRIRRELEELKRIADRISGKIPSKS